MIPDQWWQALFADLLVQHDLIESQDYYERKAIEVEAVALGVPLTAVHTKHSESDTYRWAMNKRGVYLP